jgi:UDP-N-acetylmuramate dehydrogenase
VNDEGARSAQVSERGPSERRRGARASGNGSNLLDLRSWLSRGIVVTLGPAFDWIRVETSTITAGGSDLTSRARATGGWRADPRSHGRSASPERRGSGAMNAGGHGSDTASAISDAGSLDLDRRDRHMERDELDFSYRHSRIASTDVVLEATFEAPPRGRRGRERSIEEIVRWRRSEPTRRQECWVGVSESRRRLGRVASSTSSA